MRRQWRVQVLSQAGYIGIIQIKNLVLVLYNALSFEVISNPLEIGGQPKF